MTTLKEINDMWAEDAKISELELDKASLGIPMLHAKYLELLVSAKLKLRKAESESNAMRSKKYKYFRGEMTKEELEAEGWEQYLGAKIMKSEMAEYLQNDSDMNKFDDRISYYNTMVYTLEQIMRSLNSRTWDIKNSIEFMKFKGGY